MAAACYEKEVTIESASHGLGHSHQHHHQHHRGSGNLATNSGVSSSSGGSSSNRSSAAAAAITTAAVTVIDQTVLSPSATTNLVIPSGSPYKAESTSGTNFKDYAQPLHVDCSVEYELPSQAKPPPGGGEPLLMIHPCYYRRAERERRSPFINNLPPITSSSSSGRKSNRRADTSISTGSLVASKNIGFSASNAASSSVASAALAGGDAAAAAAVVVATATAAVAATTQVSNGLLHLGDVSLNASTPSSTAIGTLIHGPRKPSSRRDDTQIQDLAAEKRRLSQHQRAAFPAVTNGSLTTADEKAVISGIYQHYFRAMRSHHQQPHHPHLEVDQLQQHHHQLFEDPHLRMASARSSLVTSPATGTLVQSFHMPTEPTSTTSSRRRTTSTLHHHPYRRVPTTVSRAPTAIPHVPTSPSEGAASSSIYATAINRHRAASLQALRVAAAAVAAAAAAAAGGGGAGGTGASFYEAPAYRALLPRS